jgi:DNA-binding beta-propeller fold protein YncE
MRLGITVAGGCNGSSSTNQTLLNSPSDVTLGSNNALYTGDNSCQLYLFQLGNRTGRALKSFSSWPSFIFYDYRTSYIYVTILTAHLAYILPTNQTIPPSGIAGTSCSNSSLYYPTGIGTDSVGNIYIASYYCHWVMKWAPNATNATIIAGSPAAVPGSDSRSLYIPYAVLLDEANSFIYVADRYNFRVQRFPLDGSGNGVTVAGGNGQGPLANQLDRPSDIFLSKLDGSIYVADCYNNRIQKWLINATTGITIAGSPNGTMGGTPYLLKQAYGLAIDDDEKYLYVSDSQNNRIQRFTLR